MLIYSGMRGARWWTIATVIACGALLVSNAVYLEEQTPRFLLEKGVWATHPLWLAAFYFHVLGASICLATGLPLMFPVWTRRYPAWHRRLGYLYFNSVLWMAAPAGLILALAAKGGWLGAAGFILMGELWWMSTWSGYRAIRRGDLPTHVREMVRSFSLALSAPSFRAIQAILFLTGLGDEANYVASLWLSLAVSVWLAESFPYRHGRGVAFFGAAPLIAKQGEIR
jgi:predicted membrane protein DUF2306